MSGTSSKMLGITVLPEYFQVEGIEPVLDNCQNIAGANAITTSPYVMRLAATGEGQGSHRSTPEPGLFEFWTAHYGENGNYMF